MMVIKNAFIFQGRAKPYVLIYFHLAHSTIFQEAGNIKKGTRAPLQQ